MRHPRVTSCICGGYVSSESCYTLAQVTRSHVTPRRVQVPGLVDRYMEGKTKLDQYISHRCGGTGSSSFGTTFKASAIPHTAFIHPSIRPFVRPSVRAFSSHLFPLRLSHRLKFSEINEAFELLHSGDALRTVLSFEEGSA